jgi:hypothetical protein
MWSAVRSIICDNELHHVILSCECEGIVCNRHLFMLDQFLIVRKNKYITGVP